jgi:predicted DCC family thiol-disulfide oxidoreductase YuxK
MAEVTVVYDEDCGFCRWSVNKVLRWDQGGRVRTVAIQSDEGSALLHELDPATRLASAHVVTPDGTVHSAGALAEPLFRALPGGRPIAAIAHTLPGATDRLYRLVARNRLRIGGWLGEDACRVVASGAGGSAGNAPLTRAWRPRRTPRAGS